jgi:hypothetical protein
MHIHSARGILDNGALVGDEGLSTSIAGQMHIHSSRGISDNGALVGGEG